MGSGLHFWLYMSLTLPMSGSKDHDHWFNYSKNLEMFGNELHFLDDSSIHCPKRPKKVFTHLNKQMHYGHGYFWLLDYCNYDDHEVCLETFPNSCCNSLVSQLGLACFSFHWNFIWNFNRNFSFSLIFSAKLTFLKNFWFKKVLFSQKISWKNKNLDWILKL